MNKIFLAFLLLLFVAVLYVLSPVLTPFLVAALLAYLSDPLVNFLMRFRLPRLISVIIVFISLFFLIMLVLLFVIPIIEKQVIALVQLIPSAVAWLQESFLPFLKEYVGVDEVINVATLKTTLLDNWTKAGWVATAVWKSALHSGFALVEFVIKLVLIPVVTFYLLRDWDKLISGIRGLLPRRMEPTVVMLVTECDDVLSAFFRGQLLVMLSLAIIYSIGLSLIGLQVGVMIGLISGLLCIVPYLGLITGVISGCIAAYIQFGTLSSVLLVCLVYFIGQLAESMFLTPKLVGHRIGLHPVAVIFSVLTGGTLFGFFGVLLALPVAAVTMVLLRFLNQRYRSSQLYQ